MTDSALVESAGVGSEARVERRGGMVKGVKESEGYEIDGYRSHSDLFGTVSFSSTAQLREYRPYLISVSFSSSSGE